MKWAVIASWSAAMDGAKKIAELLEQGEEYDIAAMIGATIVEDDPLCSAAGLGSLPDAAGRVQLEAGFMDGNTLRFGAVADLEGYRSPIRIACSLAKRHDNTFLTGQGASEYAKNNGFEQRNNLTEEASAIYEQERKRGGKKHVSGGLGNISFLVKDIRGSFCAATTASGLFLKEAGSIGSSPLPGAGYYADSDIGAAASTGTGNEVNKGVRSILAVTYMKMGYSAQEAVDKAVLELDEQLLRRTGRAYPVSLIALDRDGNFGVATNVPYTFVYGSDVCPVSLYEALPSEEGTMIHAAHRNL